MNEEQIAALENLIKAVEDDGPDFSESTFGLPYMTETLVARAYDGSLDAAIDLHRALLPGWSWERTSSGSMMVKHPTLSTVGAHHNDETASRALLIAVLKAYRRELNRRAS